VRAEATDHRRARAYLPSQPLPEIGGIMLHGFVYGLYDPRTGLCRYVGSTTRTITQRYAEHLISPRKDARGEWIRDLVRHGCWPSVKVLERVTDSDLGEAELFWINYLQWLGMPLLNTIFGTLLAEPRIRSFILKPDHEFIFNAPPGTNDFGLKYQQIPSIMHRFEQAVDSMKSAYIRADETQRKAMRHLVREWLGKIKAETRDLFILNDIEKLA
jgi:hypothetical protein